MADSHEAGELMTDRKQLVDYIASGCKPPENWRIGTEHEKFAYVRDGLAPIEYEGPSGIRALLDGLTQFGWEPVLEKGNPIALSKDDGSTISLEPAGQLELSGAPVENIHQTCGEVTEHLRQAKAVAADLGIVFLGLGYRPEAHDGNIPWMPKGRYKIMREYMPKKGTLGLDMMQNTCTVQVNLDFDSEQTMIEMFRIGLALQPIATALWANSPFYHGKPSEYLSFRSHIWTDTDPDRSGILPFVFEDGFGFERYVDYILDVPMYFVYRDGNYIDVSGKDFKDFMAGKLEGFEGQYPTLKDWEDHMTTAFPEVRLKKFLEMRGADGGPWAKICALPAFWTGLLYDDEARAAAYHMISDWTHEEHVHLRDSVPRTALHTPFRNQTVRDLALEALNISHGGLCRRSRLDGMGLDETHFLRTLFQTAESGLTPAEELLAAYEGRWNNSICPVFQEYAY
ncbi:MAG: glutamate--cysteine ligase [Rhodospirillales bacterium]|nr:glutamate--cysteine ligase [Rhodospirillales bacterium]MBT4040037.1 glutamate--cysteine ligase [Rhodospirillales bacterium]MBT4627864.1 glutamate--cysteine ligase [Rhodospirillales bacterium]MBT5351404.1 glutamate--cysteine ligase [Rhodospirillales bacterium]MBT6109118.1 glutamate--cysteine ligase [Rhodospirillales bacterium]